MDHPTARLLLVGGRAENLRVLAGVLESIGYTCIAALGLEGFDAAFEPDGAFDLALVDVTGMDPTVWQRCQRLHDDGVPLLVISPRQSASLQREGLAHGARSVLVKPVVVRELVELIRTLLAS